MADLIEQVRLLLGDIGDDQIYTNEQLEAYLALESDSAYLAAAAALKAIAINETLMYRYLRTDDLTVNGVLGATELRKIANDWIARDAEKRASDNDAFVIVYPHYSRRRGELTEYTPLCGL